MSTGALHFSRLKLMALSPAHYKHAHREETRALGMGTAVHTLVLGGEVIVYEGERKGSAWASFKALIAGEPFHVFDGPHRGKAWEAARDEARETGRVIVTSEDVERAELGAAIQKARRLAGKYLSPIVTREEYERAQRCADAVRSDERAAELLVGATEVPLRWRRDGKDCAGQLDVLAPGRITELKTGACVEPSWFTRQALKLGYHAQLGWYREAANRNGFNVPTDATYIVAVEPRPPFAVQTFHVTPRAIEEGERLVRMWLERLRVCEEADHWPAYCQSTVELDVAQDVELIFPEDETEEEAA